MSHNHANPDIRLERPNATASVLIVDDDPQSGRFMLEALARKGILAYLVDDPTAAVEYVDQRVVDAAFVAAAIRSADGSATDGLLLLSRIRQIAPELPVIMLGTPEPTDDAPAAGLLTSAIETSVQAMRLGCCDVLPKPIDGRRLERVLDTYLPNHGVAKIAAAREGGWPLFEIVGRSPRMIQCVELAKRVAATSAPILITGESGAGKELIAYLVHHKSRRTDGPYIRVNCAALSDSLLESELFGHEKGAFTGAYARRKGRFETADGGTLLLDEITETPLRFQAKLLRILEQQEFERVGGNENVRVNVRIISTTNRDLAAEVEQGNFRRDLYYRLSAVRLAVAPLRQRPEDLGDLVWHFVNEYARETGRRITALDPAMMDLFARYHWPGNVRQLRNVVLTSLIFGVGPVLSLADVSWLFDELQPRRQEAPHGSPAPDAPQVNLAGIPLAQLERRAILDTLETTDGNRTRAAEVLGISDRTLRDKIKRYRQEECLQTT
ncbi:MAG TPA: sigma-54-dependent Fis family transcriptional regulator [Phycisphaerales bacterium]|nr:sigma-54-dependent Fis family transcriptional regulator [Phycisphaerales bacterium]